MNMDHHEPPTPLERAFIVICTVIVTALICTVAFTSEAKADTRVASCTSISHTMNRRACIIRGVFGSEGRKAVSVAWCESKLDPAASNGQYKGVFQMGSRERRRFGHGRTVLAQAIAAKRYHNVSGWHPWSC